MVSYNYNEAPWVISQTIASWISVLGVAFAFAAILQERVQRVRNRDNRRIAADPSKMGYFHVKHTSKFETLLGENTEGPHLTTIRGLIEAGDMGLWSSAAIDQLRTCRGEVNWVPLYRSVFKMVAEAPPDIPPIEYIPIVAEHLRRAKQHVQCEKIQHSIERQRWEGLKQQINREIEANNGQPVVLEQLKQEASELGQKFVPPLRSHLYESTVEPMPVGRKHFLPSISALPATLQTNVLRRLSTEKGPEAGGAPADGGNLPRPRLVCCIRGIDSPKAVSSSSTVDTKTSAHPTKVSATTPSQGKATRTGSSNAATSVSSSIPPGVQLNQMGRQFYKWIRASSTFNLRNREASDHPEMINPAVDSLQYGEEPFLRLDTGLNDTRSAWILDNKPCIEISREELAALSIILGMQLKINDFSNAISGFGAFGTSLYASQAAGYWKVNLVHGSRTPSHHNSQGSGYTTLMAKHMACGSLPFADTVSWVRSIYITEPVLQAIKEGRHIKGSEDYGGSTLEYLRRLPSAKQIDAFYGTTKTTVDLDAEQKKQDQRNSRMRDSQGSLSLNFSDTPLVPTKAAAVGQGGSSDTPSLGAILQADGIPVGSNCTWPRAVAGIAFGGLVPQAAFRLVEGVRFTIAGSFGGCSHALEELINKLHQFDKESEVFGPYVERRVAARYGIEDIDHLAPSRFNGPREAAATFGRYMNLLERMTARCEVSGTENPVNAVYEASCELIEESYLAALQKEGPRYSEDLGVAVRTVILGLHRHLPISVEDCAVVVRCILAAWGEQVPFIELEESRGKGETEFRYCQANRLATLEDLPAVSALG